MESRKHSYVITGGKNAEVCIWEGPDDTDTTSIKMGTDVYAVGHQDGRLFTATGSNIIQISTFPEGLNDGIATRFSAPCRHFGFSKDGKTLVAGSDEFKIKVLSLEDNECNYIYTEHKAPILSVAVDPTGEFVASSSCDGTVKVWNMIDGATEMSTALLTACNHSSQAESLCRMCWSQDGEFLLVPVGKTIQILLRSSWAVTQTITNDYITDTINIMALSEDGKHLAVGCVNGFIGVFDWQTQKLVDRQAHPQQQTITSIAWNPKDPKQLAFCDKMGQLGFLENLQTVPKSNDSSTAADEKLDDADLDALDPFVMNGDGLDFNDDNSIDIGSLKRSYNLGDDDDAGSVASTKTDQPPPPVSNIPTLPPIPMDIFKPTPMQPAFQPGSTPEHLSSRFMMWNSVGVVRQNISDEDNENSIDVEFHNAATHHSLHIDNNSDYVMADLSSQALVLASRGDDDITSKLFCMHFGSWDSDKEWSVTMPEGENIEAVTVTDRWLAVATDSRYIRIFTTSGMQCQIFSLPGDIVALGSSGSMLTMVYHKAMGIPGDQCLGITIAKVRGRRKFVTVKDDSLPLSPKAKLSWLGFSDEGTPFYMDTEGIVRMMSKGNGQLWFPVCHTRHQVKGKSDHYWIVSVNERQQQIRCIPCKGSRFPATLPRPAVAILSFQIYLCDGESEKSRYEESYQRGSLIAHSLLPSHDTELVKELKSPLREALMKLFALASKSEKDFRALEVCELIEDQDLLEIAATYATRLRRIQLAERVNQVLSSRQNDDGSDDEEETANNQHNVDDEDEDDICFSRSKAQSDEEEEMVEDNVDEMMYEERSDLFKANQERPTLSHQASSKNNPFKLFTPKDRSLSKGSNVFDKVQKKTPKPSPVIAPLPVTIKKSAKKTNNQGKLTGFNKTGKQNGSQNASPVIKKEIDSQKDSVENQPVKKKVNGFDLWLEQSRDDMREEYPDLSEEDLATQAVGVFQKLPKEERQSWVQKAKSLSGTDDASMKRKLPQDPSIKEADTEATPDTKRSKTEKKAPLSQSTNAKLAMFAKGD